MTELKRIDFENPLDLDVKGTMCAMYARLAAQNLFGRKFVPAPAWDLAKRNKSLTFQPDGIAVDELEKLLEQTGPGVILGIYNPESVYNHSNDGNSKSYTHVALVVGKNPRDNNWYVFHQIGRNIFSTPLQELIAFHIKNRTIGFKIKEVIVPATVKTVNGDEERMAVLERVVENARAMIGKKYVWGGKTENGFDCSGLAFYAYNKAGIDALNPRARAREYYARFKGNQVLDNIVDLGDLCFFKKGDVVRHMGICSGNRKIIHASLSQRTVVESSDYEQWTSPTFMGFYRVI